MTLKPETVYRNGVTPLQQAGGASQVVHSAVLLCVICRRPSDAATPYDCQDRLRKPKIGKQGRSLHHELVEAAALALH